jgi:hypothetical protein
VTRAALQATLILLAAAGGVALTQPRLAKVAHAAGEREDVYALPPPGQLRAATLGWEAATVDLLWAKLLVEYGTHWSEHRDFADTPRYADAILAIEPGYEPLYRYIDTMLAYRPLQGTEADVRLARGYLERGLLARPLDGELWLEYGQFLAFVAPSFLRERADQDSWRKDGAEAMGHAVELGAEADRALTAATLLTQAGQRQAAVRYLERAYAFTEHPSMAAAHELIGRKLEELQSTAMRDAADETMRAIDERWHREMPYLSRAQYLLLGPTVDPIRCSGLEGADDPACARDFTAPAP